jgi:hypothetical protein
MQVFLQFRQLNHASSHATGPILRHPHPRAARGLPWPPALRRAT